MCQSIFTLACSFATTAGARDGIFLASVLLSEDGGELREVSWFPSWIVTVLP